MIIIYGLGAVIDFLFLINVSTCIAKLMGPPSEVFLESIMLSINYSKGNN